MRFKKEKVMPNYEVDPSITTITVDRKKEVEELFAYILEHSFVSSSLITGEPIDAVRTSDIYKEICKFFNVKPEDTEFSSYQ